MKAGLCASAIAAALAFAPTALGADVGLLATDPKDPFAAKLAAELEQLGFTVAHEESLVATSREVAIVRVSEKELDLYEVAPDGALRKRSMTAAKTDPLKAAEEVRALLLPLVEKTPAAAEPSLVAAAPPAGEHAPPPLPVSLALPPPLPKVAEIALGAGAFFGAGKPAAALSLSASFFPRLLRSGRGSLGVGAGAIAEVSPEGISASQGSADVRALLFGPEVIGRLELSSRLLAEVAVGAWANHLRVEGNAAAPFVSRDESAWTWSPTARSRLAYRGGPLAIFADARLGVALPGVAIRFDGGTVREWGRPWACIGIGIALAF